MSSSRLSSLRSLERSDSARMYTGISPLSVLHKTHHENGKKCKRSNDVQSSLQVFVASFFGLTDKTYGDISYDSETVMTITVAAW